MPSKNTQSPVNDISTKIVILLGALSALAAVSTDIYLPALNTISDDLNAENAQVQMTLAIFFLGYGFGQLFFGPLSDSLGRRPVLLTGLYIYTLSSIACSFSSSIDFLIASRLLQALGGCAAAVTSRAIIRDSTEGEQTARALAGVVATIQIAPLIAPPIGGLILLFAPWPATFLTLALYGAICIVAAHLWVKESHPKEKRQALQPMNMFLGYWETLRNMNIVLLLLAEVSASMALLTFVTGAALIFGRHYGLSPQHFSLLFALMASGLILGSYLSSRYVTKFGIKRVINLCLSTGLISSITLLIIANYVPEKLYWLVIALWFCLIPAATVRANYVALGLQYMPERTGTVSALFGAFSLGIGGITAIFIGKFDHYSPFIMACMILTGYISSLIFYILWRLHNRHK